MQGEAARGMNATRARWKLLFGGVLAAAVIAAVWMYVNRSEAIYEKVMSRQGYETILIKEGIATTFELKPEWIPERRDEVNKLNLVLEKKFNTKIILESVWNRENDIYVQLNAIPSMQLNSGHFLTTSLLLDNGSFTTSNALDRWRVTDSSGRDLLNGNYGTGDGPDNRAGITFNVPEDTLKQGVTIRYAGHNLYGYKRHSGLPDSAWLPIAAFIVAIVLAMFYRRRIDEEKGLGWKLVGYTLLGVFTFTLNGVRLPLGFAVYGLFFRKTVPNARLKRNAALMGLALYASGFVWPWLSDAVGWRERGARMDEIPYEQLGMEGIWRTVLAETSVTDQAKISSFETVRTSGGDVLEAEFRLADRLGDKFVHSEVAYDGEEQRITYRSQGSSDTWPQYNEEMQAFVFFERFDKLRMLELNPEADYPYVTLELRDDRPVNYGIRDAVKYRVDESGIHPITNEQLPVQGMWLIVGGAKEREPAPLSWDWEGWTDYLFNVTDNGET